jgi:hypothetical protein
LIRKTSSKQISIEPGVLVWQTFLEACRVHGNTKLGQFAVEYILDLEPQVEETYVLLSNIYAGAGNMCYCQTSMQELVTGIR